MSKRQDILNRLRDNVLAAIATGSGYNFTVGSVERGLREIDALPDSKFPCIYIARTTEDRENLTQNQIKASLQVVIVGYVKNSTGVEGCQEDIDDLIEDITKAIERDRTLGTTDVKWCEIKRVVTDEGDMQSLAGCAITLEIVYVSEGVTP